MTKKEKHLPHAIDAKTFAEVCDYLGNDLDSPLCKEIRDHLESCPECRLFIDDIRRTVTLCRENEAEQRVSVQCKERILEKMRSAVHGKK